MYLLTDLLDLSCEIYHKSKNPSVHFESEIIAQDISSTNDDEQIRSKEERAVCQPVVYPQRPERDTRLKSE